MALKANTKTVVAAHRLTVRFFGWTHRDDDSGGECVNRPYTTKEGALASARRILRRDYRRSDVVIVEYENVVPIDS